METLVIPKRPSCIRSREPEFRDAWILTVALICGCGSSEEHTLRPEPCTDEWARLIETLIPTSDSAGHGPDVGNDEWKSVIEFRLGVRGNPDVPSIQTEEWCEYIDDLVETFAADSSSERRGAQP